MYPAPFLCGYDFLAFEDFKPAGCEPLELRSGDRWPGGLVANVELRDEKVVFFIGLLARGGLGRSAARLDPPKRVELW